MITEYYFRKRADFGRPCNFVKEGPTIIDNVPPDETLQRMYIPKNPINKETQEGATLSCNEVNTKSEYVDRGVNHNQGGWLKELNLSDKEAMLRFRERVVREDNYIASMRTLCKPIEHAISQNNAINIYESYFENSLREYSTTESSFSKRNTYPDFSGSCRPVSHISWSPEKNSAFAASYCSMDFHRVGANENCEAYIWNVEIPSVPQTTFDSKIPLVSLEWNPLDRNFLIGGMYNGQIALYDVRMAPEHVKITKDVVSHRDPVRSVFWITLKNEFNFFSTSGDGMVKWWDCRNLSRVTDSISLELRRDKTGKEIGGASCLDYDASISSKYLVGTETGHVVFGNRKGKSLAEKLPSVIKSHLGPVYALQRNPAFSKFYLTVGDGIARIWSAECKESSIMWTKHYEANLTAGEWSKSRYSVFMVTRSDGYLDLWDLLQEQRFAFVSLKVSDDPLLALRIEGRLVVTGDEQGTCNLIQFSDKLSSCHKNDKAMFSAMLERESRREEFLEGKKRKVRFSMKLKAQREKDATSEATGSSHREDVLEKAEKEYWELVNNQLESQSTKTSEEEFGLKEKWREKTKIVTTILE